VPVHIAYRPTTTCRALCVAPCALASRMAGANVDSCPATTYLKDAFKLVR
jgi:hypothetical protein